MIDLTRVGSSSVALGRDCSSSFPEEMELLTICVSTGRSASRFSFKSHVGSGSSPHDLDGDCLISFLISASVAGVKSVKRGVVLPPGEAGSGGRSC